MLIWIDKETVIRHHSEAPFHLLEPVPVLFHASLSRAGSEDGCDGPKLNYAAACRMNAGLAREGIVFKQAPYSLEV